MLRSHSDYVAFLDTFRMMGCEVKIEHIMQKEKWQKIVDQGGYNVTSLSCVGMHVGSLCFIFSNGAPDWNDEETNTEGRGRHGSFMMAYDEAKKEIIPRQVINFGNGHVVGTKKNCAAIPTENPEPKQFGRKMTFSPRGPWA